MHIALVVSMLAVAISLGVVFVSVLSKKTNASNKKDSGDGGVLMSSTSSTDKCEPGGDSGCDGGGGH
jgi:hypothetical protein